MRPSPPTLRRRNNGKLREHRRWLIARGNLRRTEVSGYDSDSEDSSNSDADSESDSDDEDTLPQPSQTLPSSLRSIPTLTHAIPNPAASTSLPSSTVALSASQTTAKAVLPTPALGLGSTLLVGEGDVPGEAETDGITSDDDSDNETTSGTGSAKPTSATAGLTSTASRAVPTLTAVAPPDRSGTRQSTASATMITSLGIPTLSTSVLRGSGLPVPTTAPTNVPSGLPPAQALGPQVALKRSHLGGGAVAGLVLGVVVGVSILIAVCILGFRKMRAEGRDLKSMWPFPRRRSDDDSDPARPKTTGTTWTWNKNLWGAVSSSGPRTTVSSHPPPLPIADPKYDPKTNSDIINHMIQASYNADHNLPQDPNHNPVLTLHKDLDPRTPHFPPSPTSFINEKAYNALEGPWPPYAPPTPAKLKRSSKPPAISRWLDGILTPRLSRARMSRPIPQAPMEGTKWQEDPGVAGMGGLRPPPARNMGTGRETMKTEVTGSSVVW